MRSKALGIDERLEIGRTGDVDVGRAVSGERLHELLDAAETATGCGSMRIPFASSREVEQLVDEPAHAVGLLVERDA